MSEVVPTFSFLWFLGSIAIFFYGIRLCRNGLELWFGSRLKGLITSFTKNRFRALGVGVLVTLVFQSSSATVVTLISFASSGFINLFQAMGVLLGADIGTAWVVVLFSIKSISELGLLLLVFGVLIELNTQRNRGHYLAMILCGFGFVFFGLKLLVLVSSPLAHNPDFLHTFALIKAKGILMFVLAMMITPFVSSSGVLGVAIALNLAGILSLGEAFPLILGANVGTTFTPLLSSMNEKPEGKRVAMAHFIFKALGVLLVGPWIPQAVAFCLWLSNLMNAYLHMPHYHIALGHLLFSLVISILFLPFIPLGAKVVNWIYPDSSNGDEKSFGAKYLKADHLSSPLLAQADAKRELLRLADKSFLIFKKCISAFEKDDPDLIAEIQSKQDLATSIDGAIRVYLTKISQDLITTEQAEDFIKIIDTSTSLRDIGDLIVQNVLELSAKKIKMGMQFSQAGWSELRNYHEQICELFELAMTALTNGDMEFAYKVMHKAQHLRVLEVELRQNHLQRLKTGLEEAVATTSLHLGTLTAFRRVVRNLERVLQQMA